MRGQRRMHEIEGQNHDLITFFLLVSVHKLQQKCVVLRLVFIMCVVILICCVCTCHLSTGKHGTWLWTSASLSCLPSLRKAPPSEYVCSPQRCKNMHVRKSVCEGQWFMVALKDGFSVVFCLQWMPVIASSPQPTDRHSFPVDAGC